MKLPLISIVTPSFNQAAFLPQAIASVHADSSVKVEHIVIDGGSTDGSVEIIRQNGQRLAYWCSERDQGQYDAVNKGFRIATGEVLAWLNSDDQYTPWALAVVAEIFAQLPEVDWLTTRYPLRWDRQGRAIRCVRRPGYTRAGFLRGDYLVGSGRGVIQQESTFWRRSLWERAGGMLDLAYPLGGDFELWARFFGHAELIAVDTPLGGFRAHGDQRSALHRAQYTEEMGRAWRAHGGRPAAFPAWLFPSRARAKICRFSGESQSWVLESVVA